MQPRNRVGLAPLGPPYDRIATFAAALCLALTLPGHTLAQEPPKAEAKAPEVSPLTPEQHTRIRDLVQSTQARNTELNSALAVKQRELAAAYESFELDVSRVERLQGEILELQRQLLANYHRLQVELRALVGPERFAVLSARINNALRNPPKRPAEAPKGEPAPNQR
jgi:hypothetical protein